MAGSIRYITNLMQAAGVLVLIGIAAWLVVPFAYLTYDANRVSREKEAPRIYEQVYANLCPEYRDSSQWDRWFTDKYRRLSWCEDYLDRL